MYRAAPLLLVPTRTAGRVGNLLDRLTVLSPDGDGDFQKF